MDAERGALRPFALSGKRGKHMPWRKGLCARLTPELAALLGALSARDASQTEELRVRRDQPVELVIAGVPRETALSLDGAVLRLLPLETEAYRGTAVLASLGEFDLLVTGDADVRGEEQLLQRYPLPQVEVLIAGHHGSDGATGEALLEAVSPQLVLLSVGENGYGHPGQETLNRCRAAGAELRRTDRNGTITIWVAESGREA